MVAESGGPGQDSLRKLALLACCLDAPVALVADVLTCPADLLVDLAHLTIDACQVVLKCDRTGELKPRQCRVQVRDAFRLEIPEAKLPDETATSYLSHGAEVAAGRWNHLECLGRDTFKETGGTKHAHHLSRRERPLNLRRRV